MAAKLRAQIDEHGALAAEIRAVAFVTQEVLEAERHSALKDRWREASDRFHEVVNEPCGNQPAVRAQIDRLFPQEK